MIQVEGQPAKLYLAEEPYVPEAKRPIGRSSNEEILRWKDVHKGDRVCIIGNGDSVKKVKLSKIDCWTMGLNQAWRLGSWDYHCMGDQAQFVVFERERGDLRQLKNLFTTHSSGRPHGVKLWGRTSDIKYFSWDLTDGIFLNNTICSFGIQLAVWMGFTTIYLVGIDAHGRHFYGGNVIPDNKFANQRETYGLFAGILRTKRPDIEIYNLNTASAVRVFPKKQFSAVFP